MIETSGIGFLEIYKKEAELVYGTKIQEGESSQSSPTKQRDNTQQEEAQTQNIEDLYSWNDLMGHETMNLSNDVLSRFQQYKKQKDVFFDEREARAPMQGGDSYWKEQQLKQVSQEDSFDLSFEEIYETVERKMDNTEYLELLKEVKKAEEKDVELNKECENIRKFHIAVEEKKQEIVDMLVDRANKISFIKNLVNKILNHEKEKETEESLIEDDFIMDLVNLDFFYRSFHDNLSTAIIKDKKIDPHIFSEYFESCKRSRFDRPRQKPAIKGDGDTSMDESQRSNCDSENDESDAQSEVYYAHGNVQDILNVQSNLELLANYVKSPKFKTSNNQVSTPSREDHKASEYLNSEEEQQAFSDNEHNYSNEDEEEKEEMPRININHSPEQLNVNVLILYLSRTLTQKNTLQPILRSSLQGKEEQKRE